MLNTSHSNPDTSCSTMSPGAYSRWVGALLVCFLGLVVGCSGAEDGGATVNPGSDGLLTMDKDVSERFQTITGEVFCPCADRAGEPLSACLQSESSCKLAWVVADTLAWNLTQGRPEKVAMDLMIQDLQAAQSPQDFEVENRPRIGSPDAPVQLVAFEDFQCPSCKRLSKALPEVLEHHGDQISVVFKNFPLARHPDAELAARAGVAAHHQGKFWELHDLMFDNQRDLSRPALLELAAEAGLDVTRFEADLDSEETAELVAADVAEGEEADLPGTPTVYINGVDAGPELTADRLIRRVELEIALLEPGKADGVEGSEETDQSEPEKAKLKESALEREIARFDPSRDRLIAQSDGAPSAKDPEYPVLEDLMPLLTDEEKKRFFRITESEICPCGDGGFNSLDACLKKENGSCELAVRVAKVAMRTIKEGETDSAVVDLITQEVQAAKKVHEFTLTDRPHKGADPEKAKLVIVEFADFKCGYCKLASQLTAEVVKAYPDTVTVYFKNFPLNPNTISPMAAKAGLAAQEQGKFWELHDLMFEHQKELDEDKLSELAKEAGLDMKKFKAAMESDELEKAVAQDKEEGINAGIDGTPAFYLNGVKHLGGLETLPQAIQDKVE